jgi:hypothetical protein
MSGRPPAKPNLSGYNYGAISSLVLTAVRSALPRRDKEPDGAPTSLAGRIDPREMGSRVQRAVPKDLRLWSKTEQPRAVCIEPFPEIVEPRVAEWRKKFGQLQGGKEIVALTGETSADLRLLEKGDVIVCTPSQVRRAWLDKNLFLMGRVTVGRSLETMAATEERAEYRAPHSRRNSASWWRGRADVRGR